MIIANNKRHENIAEYILYLWQLEDMFRAMQFDGNTIYETLVVGQTNINDDEKQQVMQWYKEFVSLMQEENKLQHGHLEHTLHLIEDLNNLHIQLLSLPIGKPYKELFENTKPDIDTLRKKMEAKDISDIEICFRALYSVVLLRLKGGDVDNKYIKDVIEVISPLIALLSDFFKRIEDGEVDLFQTNCNEEDTE